MNLLGFLRRSKKKVNVISNDTLNFDLGASSIKYLFKGKEGSFRSSIRIISNRDEIINQDNIINVNGTWYTIGENQTSPSSQLRKADKEHFEVFMLYALLRQNAIDGQYSINLLLPFTQLADKYKVAKIINRQFTITTTDNRIIKYTLYLNGVYPEGQMSKYYIDKLFPNDNCNKIIGNIGYSTSDFVGYSMSGEQNTPQSFPIAMNHILALHNQFIQATDSSTLSVWKSEGYKYTNEQLKATREAEKGLLNKLMNDVFITTLRMFTPNRSTLYLCGGGSVALEHSINEFIDNTPLLNGYKVKVLRDKEAVYTDLFGMALYTNNKTPIDKIKNEEVAIDKDDIKMNIEQTKEETKNKSIDKVKMEIKEEEDKDNLTDKEIEIIEMYLNNKGIKGHTQKKYGEMLNVNERRFKYLLGLYRGKKAHPKEDEPINNNNIISITGGR